MKINSINTVSQKNNNQRKNKAVVTAASIAGSALGVAGTVAGLYAIAKKGNPATSLLNLKYAEKDALLIGAGSIVGGLAGGLIADHNKENINPKLREAHEDTFEILQEFNLKDVVFHCFSGNADFAKKCIKKGYYIAIGGVVTFKNAKDLKEVAKSIPLDKLLLETDAPYLAPVPYRGKLNTPAYLKYIAQEIANIREIDVEEVKKQTTINAQKLFGI